MKPILRLLTRLYPASWRKRYGRELEALIEEAQPGLSGAFDILRGALTMQAFNWTPLRVLTFSILGGVLFHIAYAYYMIHPWWSSTAIIQYKDKASIRENVERAFDEKFLSD